MLEDMIIDGFEATRFDVVQAVQRVNEMHDCCRIIVGEVACYFGERDGDGVDGEVALAQVFFQGSALKGGDIEDDVCVMRPFLLRCGYDDAAGFVMHVGIVSEELVSQAACARRGIAGDDYIPIAARFCQ